MNLRVLAPLALVALTLAGPARAQDPQQQGPPGETSPHLAAAAKAYRAPDWPGSAPARLGVDPTAVRARGWVALEVRRDARRGEATVLFAAKGAAEPGRGRALVRLRLHPTAAAARAALLADLAAIQARLERLPELGDLAFGLAREGLLRADGTFGNVAFTARALADDVDVGPLALAVDDVLRAAPPSPTGRAGAGPEVVRVDVADPAAVGTPTRFKLDVDPSGPAPAARAFVASDGASVLEANGAFELYPGQPGRVVIEVFLASADLRVTRRTFEVEVPPE